MVRLAGCIVRDEDGRILLLHRNTPELRQWELPGGKIQDETAEAAMRRELLEEVGVELRNVRFFGDAPVRQGHKEFHYSWFTGEIATGVPAALEEKFDDIRFIPVAELPLLELSANMRVLLPRLAQRVPAR